MNKERSESIQKLKDQISQIPNYSGIDMTGLVGRLNAEVTHALVEAIEPLPEQISKTVGELRLTISRSTSQVIDESKELAASNDRHAKAMFWLTVALFLAAAVQAIAAAIPLFR